MLPLLVAGLLAAMVLVTGVGVRLVTEPTAQGRFETPRERRRRRRQDRGQDRLAPLVAAGVDRLGTPLAPAVMGALGPKRLERLDQLLDAAGRPHGLNRERFAARKAAYALLLGGVGIPLLINGQRVIPLAMLLLGFFLPDIALRSEVKERQEEIQRQLPDFLDVLSVTVSAGLDFRAALDRVASAFSGPLTDEVRITLRQMMLGEPRRSALDGLRARNTSESLNEFVTALQQAEDLGAPMTEALESIAEDVRREYAQEARREAAKVEPRLSVIMTLTLIPAALIVVAVGFFVTTDIGLGGMLGF